ncbi:hypothetical protein K438DRAFT_1968653 [Mycena galopus ATCC 62051]|nr:hypothetical protein K438DRAFT_1968653 [Mycena galopus ATCC 62051]
MNQRATIGEVPILKKSHTRLDEIHNSYTYIAPLPKFTNLTGSFFNIVWEGGCPATVTTGTDNVPGATRAGPCLGGTFKDTLTMYSVHPDAFSYTYHGGPLTFTPPGQPLMHWDAYAETIRFESICGGQATYVDFISHVCSKDQIATYTEWSNLHAVSIQGIAGAIGAPILAGDCPGA